MSKCSICGAEYTGSGNDARPINDGACCDLCVGRVIVARLRRAEEKLLALDRELVEMNQVRFH
jgi:hypothetical protein